MCGYEPAPQQHIENLRANLMAGRGPGASPSELAAHQHQRVDFGSRPVAAAREQVAVETQLAAGRPMGRAHQRASRELSAPQRAPRGKARRTRGRAVALPAFLVGVVVGLGLARRSPRRLPRRSSPS